MGIVAKFRQKFFTAVAVERPLPVCATITVLTLLILKVTPHRAVVIDRSDYGYSAAAKESSVMFRRILSVSR
jgi:hypothetical protein